MKHQWKLFCFLLILILTITAVSAVNTDDLSEHNLNDSNINHMKNTDTNVNISIEHQNNQKTDYKQSVKKVLNKKHTENRTRGNKSVKTTSQNNTIQINDYFCKQNETVSFEAHVTDNINNVSNGEVVFKINSKTLRDENNTPIKVKPINGVATLNYKIFMNSYKDYTLTAVYNNNGLRLENTSTITLIRNTSNVYYVSKTKQGNGLNYNQSTTISDALSKIKTNDIIYITANNGNTYNLHININNYTTPNTKKVDMRGEFGKNIKITPQNNNYILGVNTNYTLYLTNIEITNSKQNISLVNNGNLKLNKVKISTNNIINNPFNIWNTGNLTIQNSEIKNNTASISIIYNKGKLNIINTRTTDNTANYGVIYNNATVTIDSSNFTNNYARVSGGVINNYNKLEITNTNFACNTAIYGGGAINNNGLMNITNSTLENNTVNHLGGAIATFNTSKITNNKINNNLAGNGAGIYIADSKNQILENNKYNNNYAPIAGGAVYIHNSLVKINNETYTNNNAEVGAAIYIKGSITSINKTNLTSNGNNNPIRTIKTINGNYTTENTAKIGGAIYTNNTIINIENTNLTNNKATVNGGSITTINTIITINKDIFTNNTAYITNKKEQNTKGTGGAIYSENTTLIINNSKFYSNTAKMGGAITQLSQQLTSINNTDFTNNKAIETNGGAIYLATTGINLNNSLFTKNYAKNNGSAIYLEQGYISLIINNKFINNTANSVIQATKSNVILNHNNLLDNTKEVIFEDTTYNIDENYWNTENPDMTIKSNNLIPTTWHTKQINKYKIEENIPEQLKPQQEINITINITDKNENPIKTGKITIQLNNQNITTQNITNTTSIIKYKLPNSIGVNTVLINYTDVNNTQTILKKEITILKYNITIETPKIINSGTKINTTIKVLDQNNNPVNTGVMIIQLDNQEKTININNTYTKTEIRIPETITGKQNINLIFRDDKNNTQTTTKQIYIDKYKTTLLIPDKQENNEEKMNITIPVTYDLRKYNYVTPIKMQEISGSCWAFAAYSSLESAILKTTGITYDFSENNMKNLLNRYALLCNNQEPNNGNDIISEIGYLVGLIGPVNETNDYYQFYSTLSPILEKSFQVTDVYIIPNRKNTMDNQQIKEAILKYGAIQTTVHMPDDYAVNGCYDIYNNISLRPNHSIAIIGWDDNYNNTKFTNKAPGNGAFLVKDATGQNTTGYYYISYYDQSLAGIHYSQNKTGLYINNIAFPIKNTTTYNKVYQQGIVATDDYIDLESKDIWMKNNYQATDNENIAAIGTYFLDPSTYELYFYKNNMLQYTQNGTITTQGYNTIQLKNYIEVSKQDNFTVIIKITSQTSNITRTLLEKTLITTKNMSFIARNKTSWIDTYYINYDENGYNAPIKVYTTKTITPYKITIKPTTIYKNETIKLTVEATYNNKKVDGNKIVFKLNGKTQNTSTIINGTATILSNYTYNNKEYLLTIVILGTEEYPELRVNTTLTTLPPEKQEINIKMNNQQITTEAREHIITANITLPDGQIVNNLPATLTIGDHSYQTTVINGTAKFNYKLRLNEGIYPMILKIDETNTTQKAIMTRQLTVIKQLFQTISPNTFIKNEKINITVKLRSNDYTGKQLIYYLDGKNIGNATIENKTATIEYLTQDNVGEHNLTIKLNIDDDTNDYKYKQTSYTREITIYDYNSQYGDLQGLTNTPVYYDYNDNSNLSTRNLDVKAEIIRRTYTLFTLNLTSTKDCQIYYTTDGSDPRTNGILYQNMISIMDNPPIKYYAINDNQKTPVLTCQYGCESTPYITSITKRNPAGSTIAPFYYNYINITSMMKDTKIYYTTDTSTPTINSTYIQDNGRITCTSSNNHETIIRYFTIHNGIKSKIYYIIPASYTSESTHDYNTQPEIYYENVTQLTNESQEIKLRTNKAGIIYYTINGEQPTTNSEVYQTEQILTLTTTNKIRALFIDVYNRTTSITIEIPKIQRISQVTNNPITIIQPLTNMNNEQTIKFVTDNSNNKIFYTTDGTNPQTSNTTKTITANKTLQIKMGTQIKYYTLNTKNNKKSNITIYTSPKTQLSEIKIDIINNTDNYMIQVNKPCTIYYTINGENPTNKHTKYNYLDKIEKTNKLNMLIIENNTSYRYQYKNGNITRIIPINYTIQLPCYTNITLPQVNKYDNQYDEYIIKKGINGIIKLPYEQIITIKVNNTSYSFTKIQSNNTYNIRNDTYFIPLDGKNPYKNNNHKVIEDGIQIYYDNNTTNIIIEYYDTLKYQINQFSTYYSTIPINIENTYIQLQDYMIFNINNKDKAIIEFNRIPLEGCDIAIRYQLKMQNNYTGNWQTDSYKTINKNKLPNIKYTNGNTIHYLNNGYPDYINFLNGQNTITSITTIDGQTTRRTYEISHKDFEEILKQQNTSITQKIQQINNTNKKYTGGIDSYAITTIKVSQNAFQRWLNRTDYKDMLAVYTYYLVALKTINIYDDYANYQQYIYNVTWNRHETTIIQCSANASSIRINSLTPTMGMEVYGENILAMMFRLETTSKLSVIESEMLNMIRNRTGDRRINSTIATILQEIQNNGNISYITFDNLVIIIDNTHNLSISINLETGQITDYMLNEDMGHSAIIACPLCSFNEEYLTSYTNLAFLDSRQESKINVIWNDFLNLLGFSPTAIAAGIIKDITKYVVNVVFSSGEGLSLSYKYVPLYFLSLSISHEQETFNNQQNGKYDWKYSPFSTYNIQEVIYDALEPTGIAPIIYTFFGYYDSDEVSTLPGIRLPRAPQAPTLFNGYKTIILNHETNGNVNGRNILYLGLPETVSIKVNTNPISPNFGKYDRTDAFYLNRVTGEKINLSVNETYQYFEGDSIFDSNNSSY
ncbi:FN3 associated domain-containing protein [uncultured Methanosphaera sp.]|uniref:FN3 associated domain-containing protein n=1 Tax=uncultured Methanosphaera sp. TaxID=262501 RepID=UPI0025FE3680|nr:FN3 associated domain-containing protein [uncultured Methanosphaera sp.]